MVLPNTARETEWRMDWAHIRNNIDILLIALIHWCERRTSQRVRTAVGLSDLLLTLCTIYSCSLSSTPYTRPDRSMMPRIRRVRVEILWNTYKYILNYLMVTAALNCHCCSMLFTVPAALPRPLCWYSDPSSSTKLIAAINRYSRGSSL